MPKPKDWMKFVEDQMNQFLEDMDGANYEESIKYTELAKLCALLVRKHLKIGVTLVTDTPIEGPFDDVIIVEAGNSGKRTFRNPNGESEELTWHNKTRPLAYELSPYKKTLLLDVDYLMFNNSLQWLFDSKQELICHNNVFDITDKNSFILNRNTYLRACPKKTSEIRKKYQELAKEKILIGISWKSTGINQRQTYSKKKKSTLLEHWQPVLAQRNYYFINLQYGNVKQELNEFQKHNNLKIHQDEEINSLSSLDDFAAQISALDLVISTSNTTVHLAGALGKQVWTLLPHIPDWRWTLEREDTLWYPKMRLFRQHRIGDWSDVFQQVKLALEQYPTNKNTNVLI